MITGHVGQRRLSPTRTQIFHKRQRDRIRRLWKRHSGTIRPFLPYIGFIVYVNAGALVIHVIEKYATLVPDNRSPDGMKCLKDHSYWAAMFYVISVCSTIGFGVIYPCTTPTRVLSVIYSFVGIPLVLYILADLGRRMCIVVTTIYTYFHRKIRLCCYRRRRFRSHKLCTVLSLANAASFTPRYNSSYEPNEGEGGIPYVDEDTTKCTTEPRYATEEEFTTTPRTRGEITEDPTLDNLAFDDDDSTDSLASEEIVDVPIFIGVIMLLVCLNICALFYYFTECYNVWESFYYSLLTFLSGDFITNHFEWSAPVYVVIFIGFSTLTMTVTIVQNNMQNMLTRVKREVQREMIKKQELAEAAGVVLPDDEEDNAEEMMQELMRKQGFSWMTSDMEVAKLDHFVKEAAQKRNASTQTPTDKPRTKPVLRSTGTVYTPRERVSKCVGTSEGTVNHHTNTTAPKTKDTKLQYDVDHLRISFNVQCTGAEFVENLGIQTNCTPSSDKMVAVHPRHNHWHGQTVPVEWRDHGAQNTPDMQNVAVQMSSYDGGRGQWRIS